MFDTILVANRGEIACRVIATCRRLGVRVVAVHSGVDAGARHVALADAAVAIGGPAPAEGYLDGAAIIAAARASGAQAIHPGYGFLSENPAFAAAVVEAGLVFIGPSAAAMRAMALKDAAKALMAAAGVPVVPGWQGEDQSPDGLAAEAARIGWPVLIKAVAGGGGKGMRRVDRAADFAPALAAAQREAAGAFGNPAVLLEKCIEAPRHIELQVFGDGSRAVHLFERDCSLQRRHQKVIEEAPAPGMPPEMRAAMGAAAVRAAEAIGYAGAGTVEFIVDAAEGLRPDRFWFMEMNTRLQVEHPVTEAITGIDLVEWQIRVAAGEPLPCAQEAITLGGHAVEARLYAEDPAAGFLPATGRLARLVFPEGVRVETGVRPGDHVSPWYDPMIAKIIAHGPTRAAALGRLALALDETEVSGATTNRGFLARLLRHPDVRAGRVDTGLIGRALPALLAEPPCPQEALALVALAELGPAEDGLQDGQDGQGADPWPGQGGELAGFSLWAPLVRPLCLRVAGESRVLHCAQLSAVEAEIGIDGQVIRATRRQGTRGWWLDGARPPLRLLPPEPGGAWVQGTGPLAGAAWWIERPDPLARGPAAGPAPDLVLAPMPGLVKALPVVPGAQVAAGALLVILEAMKMEHSLLASQPARVAEVLVTEGAQVEAGAALVRLDYAAAGEVQDD